jgi:hypothetical protein
VRVGVLIVRRCLRVLLVRERVQLTLQLEDVNEQVGPNRLRGQVRGAAEELAVLDRVALQVRHGLVLAGLVVARQGDGVGDEEAHVRAPLELPVEERLAGGLAVDRGDGLRDRDRVAVERLRGSRERRGAGDAEVVAFIASAACSPSCRPRSARRSDWVSPCACSECDE